MTNTTEEFNARATDPNSAFAELAKAGRSYDNAVERLKESPTPTQMIRVRRAFHARYLAGEYHRAGLVRALEVACGWRELLDDNPCDPETELDYRAMARVGRSWLLNHEEEIKDALIFEPEVADQSDRERILSLLIAG